MRISSIRPVIFCATLLAGAMPSPVAGQARACTTFTWSPTDTLRTRDGHFVYVEIADVLVLGDRLLLLGDPTFAFDRRGRWRIDSSRTPLTGRFAGASVPLAPGKIAAAALELIPLPGNLQEWQAPRALVRGASAVEVFYATRGETELPTVWRASWDGTAWSLPRAHRAKDSVLLWTPIDVARTERRRRDAVVAVHGDGRTKDRATVIVSTGARVVERDAPSLMGVFTAAAFASDSVSGIVVGHIVKSFADSVVVRVAARAEAPWSDPVSLAVLPGGTGRRFELLHGERDQVTALWGEGEPLSTTSLSVASSTDGGRSWKPGPSLPLNESTVHWSAVAARGGSVHVVTAPTEGGALVHYAFAGGRWSGPEVVSPDHPMSRPALLWIDGTLVALWGIAVEGPAGRLAAVAISTGSPACKTR